MTTTISVFAEPVTATYEGRKKPRYLAVTLSVSNGSEDAAFPPDPKGDLEAIYQPWTWDAVSFECFRTEPTSARTGGASNGAAGDHAGVNASLEKVAFTPVGTDYREAARELTPGGEEEEEEEARNRLRAEVSQAFARFKAAAGETEDGAILSFADSFAGGDSDGNPDEEQFDVGETARNATDMRYDGYLRSLADLPTPIPQAANLSFLLRLAHPPPNGSKYFVTVSFKVGEGQQAVTFTAGDPTLANTGVAHAELTTSRDENEKYGMRCYGAQFDQDWADEALNKESYAVRLTPKDVGEDDWLVQLRDTVAGAFRPAKLLVLAMQEVARESPESESLKDSDHRHAFLEGVLQALAAAAHDGTKDDHGGSLVDLLYTTMVEDERSGEEKRSREDGSRSGAEAKRADLTPEFLDAWKGALQTKTPDWVAILQTPGLAVPDGGDALLPEAGTAQGKPRPRYPAGDWLARLGTAVAALTSQEGQKAVFLHRCRKAVEPSDGDAQNGPLAPLKKRLNNGSLARLLDEIDLVREQSLDAIGTPQQVDGYDQPIGLWPTLFEDPMQQQAAGEEEEEREERERIATRFEDAFGSYILATAGIAADQAFKRNLLPFLKRFARDVADTRIRRGEAVAGRRRERGPVAEPPPVVIRFANTQADETGGKVDPWALMQGAALFVRRPEGAPDGRWQSPNVCDVHLLGPNETGVGNTTRVARAVLAALPVTEQVARGVATRDATIAYAGEPLVAGSFEAEFYGALTRQTVAPPSAQLPRFVFEPVPPPYPERSYSPFAQQPVLAAGRTLEIAVFAIGPGGALPGALAVKGKPAALRPYAEVALQPVHEHELVRRIPVGAPRLAMEKKEPEPRKFRQAVSQEESQAWLRKNSVVGPDVEPLGRRLLDRALQAGAPLTSAAEAAQVKVLTDIPEESLTLRLRPPSVSWKTFQRWQWADIDKSEIAKREIVQVLESISQGQDENVRLDGTEHDLSIDDPAVTAFQVCIREIKDNGTLHEIDDGDPRAARICRKLLPGPADPDLKKTRLAVRAHQHAPINLTCEIGEPFAIEVGDHPNVATIRVPAGRVALLEVISLVDKVVADARFPVDELGWEFVGTWTDENGADYRTFDSFAIVLEGATDALPTPEQLWDALVPSIADDRLELRLKRNDVKAMRNVARVTGRAQRWRWDGLAFRQDTEFPLEEREELEEGSSSKKSLIDETGPRTRFRDWETVAFARRSRVDAELFAREGILLLGPPRDPDPQAGADTTDTDAGALEGEASVVFEKSLGAGTEASYWRFQIEAESRYRGLLDTDKPKSAKGDRAWHGAFVRRTNPAGLPPPRLDLAIPLTRDVGLSSNSGSPGYLVMLDEPWFETAGLGEWIQAEVTEVHADRDLPQSQTKTENANAETGPKNNAGNDPIRFKDKGEASIEFQVYGPIGESPDGADAVRFPRCSFVLQAEETVPPWHMAQIRLRRVLDARASSLPADSEYMLGSEWSAPVWVQRIPGDDDWWVKVDGSGVRRIDDWRCLKRVAHLESAEESTGGRLHLSLKYGEGDNPRDAVLKGYEPDHTPEGHWIVALLAPIAVEATGREVLGAVASVAEVGESSDIEFQLGNAAADVLKEAGGVVMFADVWSAPARSAPSDNEDGEDCRASTPLHELFDLCGGDRDYRPDEPNPDKRAHGRDAKSVVTRLSPPLRFRITSTATKLVT